MLFLDGALIWTLVGTGLFTAGLRWLLESGLPAAALGIGRRFFGLLAALAKNREMIPVVLSSRSK